MKMEILLEPTSNKLLVGDLCDSTRIKLVSTGKKRCYERSHKGVKASANSDIVYFFTSAQDGDPLQDDVRLCLGDDLKKAQDHNQRQEKNIALEGNMIPVYYNFVRFEDMHVYMLDYSPASPGNTSPDPSDDLSKYLLASLAILPFHDDPYMKVMQAYNATSNELPIPLPQAPIAPPTVLPPSPVFKIGESSHKMNLERHEEQIETILNHLDELLLERIEHMDEKIKGLGEKAVGKVLNHGLPHWQSV
ncbi:hypothetical protein Tco_0322474 [Tanacetum coccineum]